MTPSEENAYHSLAAALGTRFIGKNIIYHRRLSSTMDAARREAGRRATEGIVIIAGEQTGGRGRLKRAWFTPPGNVALSVILYPALAELPYLCMIASLAVADAIETLTGLKTQIKWPNDVLISGKKVCGILVESGARKGEAGFAIVGIGINVRLRPGEIEDIATTATSLENEGAGVSPLQLVRAVLEEFERLYLDLPDGSKIFAAWRERLVTLGRKVTARSGESVMEGVAEDVDESGALLIRQCDNALSRVVAGDVSLRNR